MSSKSMTRTGLYGCVALCTMFVWACDSSSSPENPGIDIGGGVDIDANHQNRSDASSARDSQVTPLDLALDASQDASAIADAENQSDLSVTNRDGSPLRQDSGNQDMNPATQDATSSTDSGMPNLGDAARNPDEGLGDTGQMMVRDAGFMDGAVIPENDGMMPAPCIEPPPAGDVLIIEGQLGDRDPSYLRTDGQCQPTGIDVKYDLIHFCSAGGRSITFQFRTGVDDPMLTTPGLGIFGYMNNGFRPDAPTDNCLNGQVWDAGRPPNRGTSYGFGPPLQLVVSGVDGDTRGSYRVVVCGDQLGVRCRDPRDP